MTRQFIEITFFRKSWAALGLDDDALDALERQLLANPNAGAVMPGCGGARKVRVALPGQGKSGSGRVIYVDFILQERIYLLFSYPKSKQENLTTEQKKYVRDMIKAIKAEGA